MTISAETIKDFHDKYRQIFAEFDSINSNINLFRGFIKDLSDKYAEVDALRTLYSTLDEVKSTHNKHCESMRLQKESICKEILDIKCSSQALSDSIIRSHDIQDRLITLFEDFKKSQECKDRAFQESCNAKLDGMRKEFQDALIQLRGELVVPPSMIFEQNNQMMLKIESASLDSSNAMLKMNNVDTNIRIIEKKLESLYILLKKIDLSQQV